ncbi:hypothetical protein [Peribacillus muralis]|uniref:hypothetical protein n=1 Tax=Peribacillus muralis TaxID=264697 RepID=UPI000709DE35|nr:hypothetical protein [Peribacillus muralis]
MNSVNSDSISIAPRAQTGSWVWSKWTNYTVTVTGKFTTTVITAAIVSKIPVIGWAASVFATIMITNNMKTGYFKKRGASRADTYPHYLWSKQQVNLYKDKARTILKSSKTSDASKVRM